ncbi:DUF309 domain-containing protein [Rhodobacter sp. NTK016B]|uniref:DUF309 domain-containing protein n=1 Tax=Rhodobacter sp. NTK016B TaxID=2759676 RepID=UPI001A8F7E34|nr:DUF309 domain-containing protein [Rhodobacter sp. NTK016B]MBN8293514.1 DUF309 domain-containing protein [Rhodobacter sp. NTK016B]
MIDFPDAPHHPGRNPRPDPAIFAPLRVGLDSDDPERLARSPAFSAGFEAFAARYYWEAHEIWEPVWMALPPASAERHLLRGLIQLANAALKARMGRAQAASRILPLANAALSEAFGPGNAAVMGVTRPRVASMRQQAEQESAL